MKKVVSIKRMRKAKNDCEFFDKIHDQIITKYNDYLLVLESGEGIAYSHSGHNPDGFALVAKFIEAKEKSGVITVDDFLTKLNVALKGGSLK